MRALLGAGAVHGAPAPMDAAAGASPLRAACLDYAMLRMRPKGAGFERCARNFAAGARALLERSEVDPATPEGRALWDYAAKIAKDAPLIMDLVGAELSRRQSLSLAAGSAPGGLAPASGQRPRI